MTDSNVAELTDQSRLFAAEYVVDFNGKAAAARVGVLGPQCEYKSTTWLRDPRIQALIREHKHKVALRSNISADWTLEKLRQLADTEITDILGLVLSYDGDKEKFMAAFRALPVDVRASVKSVKWTKYGPEIIQHDKPQAIMAVGKYFGLFNDKLEITGANGGAIETITTTMTPKQAADAYAAQIKAGKA